LNLKLDPFLKLICKISIAVHFTASYLHFSIKFNIIFRIISKGDLIFFCPVSVTVKVDERLDTDPQMFYDIIINLKTFQKKFGKNSKSYHPLKNG
jgi:hypothetical protein